VVSNAKDEPAMSMKLTSTDTWLLPKKRSVR